MRIGYQGFTTAADVLIPPPGEVSYEPLASARKELSSSGLVELRNYATTTSYTINLSWRDLDEPSLTLLAFIPPDELVTLVNEAGFEQLVVFSEPSRNMLPGITDRLGRPLYSVTLVAHPVVVSTFETNNRFRLPQTLRNLGSIVPPELEVPMDEEQPERAGPSSYSLAFSPVSSGLPPTLEPGEAVRFTFDAYSNEVSRGRYYSSEGDAYLELEQPSAQVYPGWFSHLNTVSNGLSSAQLERWPFPLSQQWGLYLHFWASGNLAAGTLLRADAPGCYLHIGVGLNTLYIIFHNGTQYYTTLVYLAQESYARLGLRYRDGVLEYLLGDMPVPLRINPVLASRAQPGPTGTVLGGGGSYLDDALFASTGGLDLTETRSWYKGTTPAFTGDVDDELFPAYNNESTGDDDDDTFDDSELQNSRDDGLA